MKRRKAKTVTFTAPTYIDYSDFDYSSDEDDLEAEFFAQQQQQQQRQQQQQQAQQEQQQAQQNATQQSTADPRVEDETARVEPLKMRSKEPAKADAKKQDSNGENGSSIKPMSRSSEEIFETRSGDGPKKTSDGTVRDSFFKDDTVETKKITLTPNLLRDDNTPRASSESIQPRPRPSLDKLDKDGLLKDDKKKKDKKDKDKKPSAIRNFFSRKDKKRNSEDDEDSLGKPSLDVGPDGQDRELEDEPPSPTENKLGGPQRQSSKLQKQQPRTEPSPTRKPTGPTSTQPSGLDLASFLTDAKVNNVDNVPPATMRVTDSTPDSSLQKPSREKSPKGEKSAISKSIAAWSQSSESRPQKVTKSKSRAELDDFDEEEEVAPEPTRTAPAPEEAQNLRQQARPNLTSGYGDNYTTSSQSSSSQQTERAAPAASTPPGQRKERLSESPVQVSPVNSNNPPPLMVDTSSQEEENSSLRSTPSPVMIEHEDGHMHGKQDSITTSTSATTANSTWNDTNLRAFFDSGSDIRDLLMVVYDKTDVTPAGPDHPVVGTLFKEQNARLAEITTVCVFPSPLPKHLSCLLLT
jgi:hypothetical protein